MERANRRAARRNLNTATRLFCCLAVIGASLNVATAMTRVESTPTGFGQANDYMGKAVAVYGDTALAGAPSAHPAPLLASGVVQVFRHGDAGWIEEAVLLPSDPVSGQQFGAGVALSQDLAVVGSASGNGSATYTFVRDGTDWTQTDKLTFGSAPSLSGDTLALNNGLIARIYVRTGGAWMAEADLEGDTPPDQGEFVIGAVVSGDIAVISTAVSPPFGDTAFAAYFFARSNGTWIRETKIDLGEVFFGAAPVVALSGETALIALSNIVQVYARSNGTWSAQGALDPGSPWDLSAPPGLAIEGDVAVVGAPADDVLGTGDAGSAYVFTRSGDTWTRTARPYDPIGGPAYFFGSSVALSGTTLVVGSPGAIIDDVASGKMTVFEYAANAWTPVADLGEGNAHAGEQFGESIAVSGTTLVVGAPNASTGISFATGVAYVFELVGQTWVQSAALMPSSQDHYAFASTVALDGETFAASSVGDNIGDPNDYSAVYVFSKNGDDWQQQARIGSGLVYTQFGISLGLVGDTLAIGDSGWSDREPTGRVRLFARAQGAWTEQATIQPVESADGDLFGRALAMSADTMIVGAPGANVGIEAAAGAAYVFRLSGGVWQEQARLVAPMPLQGSMFGQSVALAADTVAIGATYSSPTDGTGAAYVFTRNGDVWTLESALSPPGGLPPSFGAAVALSADAALAVVGAPQAIANNPSGPIGAAYVFSRHGTDWLPRATLQGSQSQYPRSDLFGSATTFYGDNAFIGAPAEVPGGGVYVLPLGDAIFANGFD